MTGDLRLLGAGRLAIEVPSDWPVVVGPSVVRRDMVVLPEASTPARHRWDPQDDAVVVVVDHFPPVPFGQSFRPAGQAVEIVALSPRHRLAVGSRRADPSSSEDGRTCLLMSAPSLGGQFTIVGPDRRVRDIAASVQLVPEGFAAVPNVLVSPCRFDPPQRRRLPGEVRARAMVERAGLEFEKVAPGAPGRGRPAPAVLRGSVPAAGSLVPLGSVVVVEFGRDHSPGVPRKLRKQGRFADWDEYAD